jgi:hypothetical protein
MQASVNEIVLGFVEKHPEKPFPRAHPIITLIGEEFLAADMEKRPLIDIRAFTTAIWTKRAQEVKVKEPQWPTKLTMLGLPALLEHQTCDHWWLPGEPDADDIESEEEMDELGAYWVYPFYPFSIHSFILSLNR